MADRSGPPDFIGVGALGSGTHWWHDLLLEHPDVRESTRGKEVHFFCDYCRHEMTDADVAAYHELFPRPAGAVSGEWTPRYMYDPWTPLLLRRSAPDARILMILSDPIQRYRLRLARIQELAEDPEEEMLYLVDAVARGRYASQLRNVRAWFPEDRVLVLQGERCLQDPLDQYVRTLRFLGLRDFVPRRFRRLARGRHGPRWYIRALDAVGITEDVRSTARRKLTRASAPLEPAPLWPDIEASLHDELDPEVAELRSMVRDLDLRLWPHFAHLAAEPAPPRTASA